MGELQAFHRQAFGEATKSRHRVWLVRRIAWRLQAQAEGGLSERALARAAALSEGQPLRQRRPPERGGAAAVSAQVLTIPGSPGQRLAPGTVLRREWQGTVHQVVVHPEGFEYDGQFFRSISAVARAITGTRWNGLVFFGLKKSRPPKGRGAA